MWSCCRTKTKSMLDSPTSQRHSSPGVCVGLTTPLWQAPRWPSKHLCHDSAGIDWTLVRLSVCVCDGKGAGSLTYVNRVWYMPGQRTKQFTHSHHSQRWLLKAGGLTHEHTDKHKAPPPTPHAAFEGALVTKASLQICKYDHKNLS